MTLNDHERRNGHVEPSLCYFAELGSFAAYYLKVVE